MSLYTQPQLDSAWFSLTQSDVPSSVTIHKAGYVKILMILYRLSLQTQSVGVLLLSWSDNDCTKTAWVNVTGFILLANKQ